MNHITKVIPQEDFTLILLFDSGELRMLDLRPHIEGEGIWGQLRDWDLFSKVQVQEDFGGLAWSDELDYCPDSAFLDSEPLPVSILNDLMDVYSVKKKEKKEYRVAG